MTTPFPQACISAQSFVLCERSSGAIRFRVEAELDGSLPVEKVAGLLAMHCLVRGQAPEDYELLVATRDCLFPLVAERTGQLLAAGRALGAGVKVSRREQQVLDGILQHQSNKQIAAKLNVSERTVKFHVSSLLAKFGVTDRIALTREVQLGRTASNYQLGEPAPHSLFGFPVLAPTADGTLPNNSSPTDIPKPLPKARNRVLPIIPNERYAT